MPKSFHVVEIISLTSGRFSVDPVSSNDIEDPNIVCVSAGNDETVIREVSKVDDLSFVVLTAVGVVRWKETTPSE